MSERRRRGVTRGYVAGLTLAVVIIALTLLIVAWSAISVYAAKEVISTPDIGSAVVPLMLLVLLLLLAWSLWRQALVLLRGRYGPAWAQIVLISVGGYLLWCVMGVIAGLSLADTWVSPYAASLAIVWGVSCLIFWALLARRVYTDRPTPRWPWERDDDDGPDWNHPDNDPWRDGDRE
ncbi:MAG: hypothetical protein GX862_10845 [Leucobacter sp.]|nr:hypothetical protein [Leucobacter sp.]